MKIAFIIGHDAQSPGAWSPFLHQNEYFYNCEVACYLAGLGDIYRRPSGGGYKTQQRKLADLLNPKNYDLVTELHFNKFDNVANGKGHGVEVVAFPGSKNGIKYGAKYCEEIEKEYKIHNRGVKFTEEGGRGYWFLKYQKAPALILEPFFGDEPEAELFTNPAKYADVIKRAFCE